MDKAIFKQQFNALADLLVKEQNTAGFWTGRLASSALATAVAIVALKIKGNPGFEEKIEVGLTWLFDNGNNDGGYGDTPESNSNVSTSLLCYAAISYCGYNDQKTKALAGIELYLVTRNILFGTGDLISSILKFYGKDYTFSVPILSMLTICGVLDNNAVKKIPQLPFELTVLPASLYRFFNMQVVSYAIPALVAVGLFVFKKREHHSLYKLVRNRALKPALKKLSDIVPESGGFLEAIPLTGFVCMCLMDAGIENEVVEKGTIFLEKQQRKDGSWPIDTNLSTWVTTLSIKALGPEITKVLTQGAVTKLKGHLLDIQYKEKHPFNGAAPGGWGWTSFAGSVPDVDDSAGAILALLEMYKGEQAETEAIINGCKWLIGIQNKDGGFPTFCKGWGRLPFDSSCADLTGHAIAALLNTIETLNDRIPKALRNKFYSSAFKASKYLQKNQHADGYWLPLWFGNQHTRDQTNPVYGTAKVSIYLRSCLLYSCLDSVMKTKLEHMLSLASAFLIKQQNKDGSWGGKQGVMGTIEETSLAVSALIEPHARISGLTWLAEEYKNCYLHPNPIGLYFAALWYDEKMYPLIYYIEALRIFLQ
jgi:squalene-hopene/tetraprenyl-beta-curcumene cyclase